MMVPGDYPSDKDELGIPHLYIPCLTSRVSLKELKHSET